MNNSAYRWLSVPRWYLWDGGFLLIGKAQGVVPEHSHHAIQIVISLDQPFTIRGDGEAWIEARGIVVRPDAVHSFDCNGAFGAMLFVDPESSEGVWLDRRTRSSTCTVTERSRAGTPTPDDASEDEIGKSAE